MHQGHPDGYSNEEWRGMIAVEDHGSTGAILPPWPFYHALAGGFEVPVIPAVSEWGVPIMALLSLGAGTLVLRERSLRKPL